MENKERPHALGRLFEQTKSCVSSICHKRVWTEQQVAAVTAKRTAIHKQNLDIVLNATQSWHFGEPCGQPGDENSGPSVRGAWHQSVGRLPLGYGEGPVDAQAPRMSSRVVIASEFVVGRRRTVTHSKDSCDAAKEALPIAC